MYINFKLLREKGIEIKTITDLIAVKQNKTENLSEYLSQELNAGDLRALEELGYITYRKAKNKAENAYNLVRTTDKANKLLDDITTPEVDEDSLKIFEWVKSIYLRENKEIGNQKRTKMFIAQFTKESGISKNHLCFLIQSFLADEKEFTYSQRMQYLFFKGESLFSVKFDLHSSRLYQYYLKNEQYFLEQFSKINNG